MIQSFFCGMAGCVSVRRVHRFGLVGARALFGMLACAVIVAGLTSQVRRVYAQNELESDQGTQGIDVVVILDDSGSMATCWPWTPGVPPFEPPCREPSVNPPSDPTDLRYSAARLLMQVADENDRIAVIRFDAVADGVGALGTLQRIGDENNRRALTESLQPPNEYLSRGWTRIDLGMELARSILESARSPGRNQFILLLTDGEPTQPLAAGPQDERVTNEINRLREAGVLTFPVVLCNEVGGCPAEFVREQFTEISVAEATTAAELLPAFAEIFTQMKPDRSVLTGRNSDGQLAFATREAHGARSLFSITTRDGLVELNRDDSPMLPRNIHNDNNISINVLDSDNLGEGDWTISTVDGSGFAVVRTDSYPQLLNPPPSAGDSAVSIRYYPTGRPPLLLVRGVGPGANEALILNDQRTLSRFGESHLYAYLPSDSLTNVRLQLGEDANPLQLIRAFRLSARSDLPRAQAVLPAGGETGVQPNGRARLQAAFGDGPDLQGIGGSVFVFESDSPVITPGADGRVDSSAPLVYQANMSCADRLCIADEFEPVDGRVYQVYFVLQGQIEGVRFSDWVHAELALSPAVSVGGLPSSLDLSQMPPGGWPLELSATTLEEIGELTASLQVQHTETGEEVRGLGVEFDGAVPMEGVAETALRITGLDRLRPGSYSGVLTLQARGPSGAPVDVTLRPGTEFPLSLTVDRPAARLDDRTVDFGEVQFNTSPNFRLNEEFWVPLSFEGFAFPLDVEPVFDEEQAEACSGLTLTAGEPQTQGDGLVLPLRVNSNRPIEPGLCAGSLRLSGPNDDYDVFPNQLDWQVRVTPIEWSIMSGDFLLPDLQDAGARIETTLMVRFTGEPPFVVEIDNLQAEGSAPINQESSTAPRLGSAYLDIPAVEVTGEPNENGVYAVPLTLVTRQGIPFDPVRGTFYSGEMQVSIAGLSNAPRTVNFAFRSPSIVQRYFAPWVVPVYSMPFVICTGPLTLFLLLFAVARIRGRGVDHEELEQTATVAAMQMKLVDDEAVSAANEPFAEPASTPAAGTSWDAGEWGSVWDSDSNTSASTGSGGTTSGSTRSAPSDPWTSSW